VFSSSPDVMLKITTLGDGLAAAYRGEGPRVAEKSRSKKYLKSRMVNSKLWFAPIKEILLSVPRLALMVFIHCLSR
jgi:hypothetical protein